MKSLNVKILIRTYQKDTKPEEYIEEYTEKMNHEQFIYILTSEMQNQVVKTFGQRCNNKFGTPEDTDDKQDMSIKEIIQLLI